MGFLDSVKNKLGLDNQQDFNEYDDCDEERSYDTYDEYDEDSYDFDSDVTSTDMFAGARFATQDDYRMDADSSRGYSSHNGGVKVVPREESWGSGVGASSGSSDSSYKWRSRGKTDARHATVSLQDSASSAFDEFLSSPRTAPSRRQMKIVAPASYAEAEEITLTYKVGTDVALSLSSLRPDLAKRILDFSFGVVSALGGTVEKVGEKVFLLSHSTTGITEDETRQLREAGLI